MSKLFEIRTQLTGPGGPFEIVEEDVDGLILPMYKDRLPHLRAVAEMAGARGDDVELIVYGDERIGYGSFFTQANSVSAGLADCGVAHGDKVAILSQNNPAWALGFWGTVNLGAVLVGLNGWWKTEEVVYGLQDSGAKVLIADKKRFDRVVDRLDECPDLEWIFLADADAAAYDDPRIRHFDELRTATDAPLPDVEIAEADHAVIFYTSGTTGKPKGAISTHRSMICNMQNTFFNSIVTAMMSAEVGDPEEMLGASDASAGAPVQTASLMTSPLFHVSGCHSGLVVGTAGGLKIVMCEGKFEPDKVLGLIQDEKIKIWATVPTMVWRVCEFPDRGDYDTSAVTSVAFGGSPSADELQRKVLDTFPNVSSTSNAYGLTESSSVATVIGGPDALAKPTSVGPPVPTVRIKTVDAEGNETAPFSPGEVLIQGPILMAGYHNKPEATAETIIGGWLHTGDIGHLDDEGFLYITDRAKDMIIRGGENIYCVEIENRLVAHPAIADAAIIGVPHPELGEEVKAVISVEAGNTLTEADVKTWVAETLANFKVPAYVEFTDDKLPRNASGKLLKNVLRGEGEFSFSETM